MMTKKCYACILTAKESMKEIQRLARNPGNICRIMSIATKFTTDFGDVNPDWKPGDPVAAPNREERFVQPAAPASASRTGSYAVDPRASDRIF